MNFSFNILPSAFHSSNRTACVIMDFLQGPDWKNKLSPKNCLHGNKSELLKCLFYYVSVSSGCQHFKVYFINYGIRVVPISLSLPPLPSTPLPSSNFPLSSFPWVMHITSLASPFPILFLTSPCLFCTYYLCFLFSVPFLPFSLLPLPADNPPRDLYFCEYIPVLVVCLLCFCFFRFSCC